MNNKTMWWSFLKLDKEKGPKISNPALFIEETEWKIPAQIADPAL